MSLLLRVSLLIKASDETWFHLLWCLEHLTYNSSLNFCLASLHKSLSQESQLRDQFNDSLVTIEGQVKSRDQVLAKTQKDNSQLVSQLNAVANERNSLVLKVQQLEQENAHMKQENEK